MAAKSNIDQKLFDTKKRFVKNAKKTYPKLFFTFIIKMAIKLITR